VNLSILCKSTAPEKAYHEGTTELERFTQILGKSGIFAVLKCSQTAAKNDWLLWADE
jgi:hypothetical protein